MLFFTDAQTAVSSLCLCNINSYPPAGKHVTFIDPGVMELRTHDEYRNIDRLHALAHDLPPRTFISIDYPSDMCIEKQDEFILKSWYNNVFYQDIPRYICTVQFRWQDAGSFMSWWKKHRPLWEGTGRVVALGNMCRILWPNTFTDLVFDTVLRDPPGWLHVYGMGMRLMRKYVPMFDEMGARISVDSTKWTRIRRGSWRTHDRIHCTKENRDDFFLDYVAALQEFTAVAY